MILENDMNGATIDDFIETWSPAGVSTTGIGWCDLVDRMHDRKVFGISIDEKWQMITCMPAAAR